MNKGNYILVKSSFVPAEEYTISLQEVGSFLFSEKIRAIRSVFPFLDETFNLINLKLLLFNQTTPDFLENNGAVLKRQLERTLTKNKHFLGAVLTISFRMENQKIYFTIQSEKTENTGFELNEKGMYVTVFDKIQKATSSISNLSLGSEIYWKIAENYLAEGMVDQLLIVNTAAQITEIPESNIFLIKGKYVKGASIGQGAYTDISKPLMLDLFENLNFEYTENEGITLTNIQEADEILTVNAIEGIRWIIGFEGKRYFNNSIRKICELFNKRMSN